MLDSIQLAAAIQDAQGAVGIEQTHLALDLANRLDVMLVRSPVHPVGQAGCGQVPPLQGDAHHDLEGLGLDGGALEVVGPEDLVEVLED